MPTTTSPIIARTVADLTDLVQQAVATSRPIVDYGIAHGGVGHAPASEGIRLRLEGGVIEHYERDMTVRVHAGMPIGKLQAAMAATGQFMPIDADDDLTIGEIIAHNVYGPLRQTYGGVRDLLLGLHFVDGHGRDIQPGGRTVKNVAGLDLTRLMVGSLGEYGIIHQATLRTYAIPETVMMVDLHLDQLLAVDGFVPRWLLTDAAPAWLDLSLTDQGWRARMGYLGRRTGCIAQLRSLETLLDNVEGIHIDGTGETDFASLTIELTARRQWQRTASTVVKLVVPPSSTGDVCDELHRWAHRLHTRPCLDAMPAHGTVWVGGELDGTDAMSLAEVVRQITRSRGGFLVWHRRADALATLPPFEPMPEDLGVMSRIRRTLDPAMLFNRGRCLPTEAPAKESHA